MEVDSETLPTAPTENATVAPEPTATTSEQPEPVDDYACETLYIQNLNEKIKPEGMFAVYCISCCSP